MLIVRVNGIIMFDYLFIVIIIKNIKLLFNSVYINVFILSKYILKAKYLCKY